MNDSTAAAPTAPAEGKSDKPADVEKAVDAPKPTPMTGSDKVAAAHEAGARIVALPRAKKVKVTITNVGEGPVTVHAGGQLHKTRHPPLAIALDTPGKSHTFETAGDFLPYQTACAGLKNAKVLKIDIVELGPEVPGNHGAPIATVPEPAAKVSDKAAAAVPAPEGAKTPAQTDGVPGGANAASATGTDAPGADTPPEGEVKDEAPAPGAPARGRAGRGRT
jgi:hypothetical protein